jgi:predicted exporter
MPATNISDKVRKLVTLAKEAASRLEKLAAEKQTVKAAAQIVAGLLVERGYIPAYKKEAMAKALLRHDKALEVIHDLANSSKTKQANSIFVGQPVEKDASVAEPSMANYRGWVPIDRTIAGQRFFQKIVGN